MSESSQSSKPASLDACITLLCKKEADDTTPYCVLTKKQISDIKIHLLDSKLNQELDKIMQQKSVSLGNRPVAPRAAGRDSAAAILTAVSILKRLGYDISGGSL